MENIKTEYRPSLQDYVSAICLGWCGALIGFLGWRFLWVLDYEITRSDLTDPFAGNDSQKFMDVDVFRSFEALPGIPMLVIGLMIILFAVEVFFRQVVVTTSKIESKSPLRIYRQRLEVESISDSRTTWLARIGKVVELRYQGRWILFVGNKQFTDVVGQGFLHLDPYANLKSNQSEHSTE